MVYLGEKISREYLNHLRKGDVLLWENFPLKEKRKTSRFVILTECNEHGEFFVVRASSSPLALIFYRKNRKEKILIEENKEKSLPKETILDFIRAIRVLNIEDMIKLCGLGLKRIGRLSEKLIDEIDKLVKQSKVIERKWQKRILESGRSEFEE